MNAPSPRAEFAVEPNQYAYEALSPFVNHPELSGDTIDDFFAGQVAHAFVTIGRAALTHEDVGAYQKWAEHTEDYVDKLQFRPISFVPGQFYGELAQMHFYGAIHGNGQAAEKLNALLDYDPDEYAINRVLDACAQEDISPHTWIMRFKPDVNKRAAAWHNYVFTRRWVAAERGESVSHDDLLGLGAGYVVDDYIAGELSAQTAFMVSSTMYDLSQTVEQKNNIIDRLSITLQAEEPETSRYRYLYEFATLVNADPDIVTDKKEDLAAR